MSEILLIAVIGLLVLGPKRLPEVARGLGEAMKSFQDALNGSNKRDGSSKRDNDEDASGSA